MLHRSLAVLLSAVLLGVGTFVSFPATITQAQSQPATRANAVPGQILVKYRKTASAQAMGFVRQRIKSSVAHQFPGLSPHLQLQQLPPHVSLPQALAILRSDPNVEFAEPNYIYKASVAAPDDTYFDFLWGLNNAGQLGGVKGVDIGALQAWDVTTGSAEVVVGVIDTGIDYLHLDLADNVWTNAAEIPDNGLDDDENGFVDDVYGWNAYDGTGDPMDDHNHGTHVAGIIGAVGNNGEGITGVNWNVKLMGLKFLDARGSGFVSGAIECIEYAVEMKRRGVNIRVLNASWGGPDFSQALGEAIDAAHEAGILVVAAAGNNGDGTRSQGIDNDQTALYPASYDFPNVISVAAVDRRGELASFSNYGAQSVDLAAPGVSIASTVAFDRYAMFNGTSMAAPHVSGVAALALSVKPEVTTEVLKETLLHGAVPLTSLEDKTLTGGLVNAVNTLQLVAEADPPHGDFQLSFATDEINVRAGESVNIGLLASSINGFNGPVTLLARFDPDFSDALYFWSSNPVEVPAEGEAMTTLTLIIPYESAATTYTLIVEGTSGDLTQQASLMMTIEPALPDPTPGDSGGPSGLSVGMIQPSQLMGGFAPAEIRLIGN